MKTLIPGGHTASNTASIEASSRSKNTNSLLDKDSDISDYSEPGYLQIVDPMLQTQMDKG